MPEPRQSEGNERPQVAGDHPDRLLATLAAAQHGVIARRQLLDAGLERIHPEDAIVLDGIPVTTVARTLVDLAVVVQPQALRKALEEAERSHRLDTRAIDEVLRRTRGRNGPGHGRIARALVELASTGTTITRSALEDRFLALVAEQGLPRPLMNAVTEGIEVDAMWPTARLVVELDGWAYHRTHAAFQRDRDRTNALQAAGYAVLRFTHDDVVRRPAATAKRIAQAAATTG